MSTGDMTGAGYAQARATKDAAKIASRAAIYAANLQQDQFNKTRSDMAPWLYAGQWALGNLEGMLAKGPGEYQESPYYNFLQEEGVNARERGAAAKGMQFSGAEQKELTKFGQNLASTDYDAWLNRWYQSLTPYQSLAGVGQTTGAQLGQLGAQSALAQGGFVNQAGQYGAAGMLGYANTLANTQTGQANSLGQIGQNALNQYLGNRGTVQQSNVGYGGYVEPGYGPGVGNIGFTGAEMNSMTWL